MRRRSIVASVPLVPLAGTLAACGGTQTAPSNAAPGAPGTPATSGPGGTPAPRAGTTPAGPGALAATAGGRRTATIELEKGGSITIELFPSEAPRWVDNFVQKANAGFYNGLLFHRVENWVVQGGDPTCRQFNPTPDPANPSPCGTGGSNSVPTEFSRRPFVAGSLGVARRQQPRELSNDSQFFFVTQPGPAQTGGKWTQLDEQYTHFGQVIQGMEVVRAIQPGDKMRRITIQG